MKIGDEKQRLKDQISEANKIALELMELLPANPKLPLIWEIKERTSALLSALAPSAQKY